MADDPTTTEAQAERDPTSNRARAERLIARALPSLFRPVLAREVRLELAGRFEVVIYGGYVWVAFFAGGAEPLHTTQIRLDLFESEDEAAAWALETAEMFAQNWRDVMAFETARHFNNIGRFRLFEMGRGSLSTIEEVIAEQTKQLEKNLREWFRLPTGRGRRSKWRTGKELGDVLLDILTEKNPALTWAGLREELAGREPERAPASGAALRALADRFGLKLRALRKSAARRRRTRDLQAAKSRRAPNAG